MTSPAASDRSPLEALVRLVESPACDAMHVRVAGTPVLDWATERGRSPIETMSMTKSVVSMVVGCLFTDGLLDTIDRPASDFLPVWSGTEKAGVTLRHILEHTSGLACRRTTEDIYASPDFVRHALEAELVAEPGTSFTYNNRAVNLLAEVVRQASGRRLDDYAAARLFDPLGIREWSWALDASGNPHCMAGLRVSPVDVAAFGQVMAQDGMWNGGRILDAGWVGASTTPSRVNASHGLLWWLLGDSVVVVDDDVVAAWRAAVPPVAETFVAALAPVVNRQLDRDDFLAEVHELVGERAWGEQTWGRGLPDGRLIMRRVTGFYASGSGGQFLVVLPGEEIVASRMWAMESPFEDVAPLADLLRALQAAPEGSPDA